MSLKVGVNGEFRIATTFWADEIHTLMLLQVPIEVVLPLVCTPAAIMRTDKRFLYSTRDNTEASTKSTVQKLAIRTRPSTPDCRTRTSREVSQPSTALAHARAA